MKAFIPKLLLCSILPFFSVVGNPLSLNYDQPASEWTEALPIGNGRLGAMVFGGVAEEHLQLNESTFWSGGPTDWNNPSALEALPEVRAAALAGDYAKATALYCKMQGPYVQSYQPLGDLSIRFQQYGEATDYSRSLDIERAVATTTYRIGDATYTREVFTSFPDQVIVMRITCDQPGRISFDIAASSLQRHSVEVDADNTLIVQGQAPSHVDPSYLSSDNPIRYDDSAEGMRFDLRLKVIADGARIYRAGSYITVERANEAVIIVSAATSFDGAKRPLGADPTLRASEHLEKALGRSYDELLSRHLADYQRLFNRVSIDLGTVPAAESLPTPERVKRFANGEADPQLATLLYQYGRYLLISSSREGSPPANLQGIWNPYMRPPWSSDWTLNINTEMNYWPAEIANLPECHFPLFDFIDDLAENGQVTAKVNYGTRGWVAHHNSDIWAQTAAVGDWGNGDPKWANWTMGGAWLATHLWEHYAYGLDEDFLRNEAWEPMKGAAEFCLDWLVEDKNSGYLVTAPSTSPENSFWIPGTRQEACVAVGATMDLSIMWELFTDVLEAAKILKIEDEFTAEVAEAKERLFPLTIGSLGQIQEWRDDFEDVDPHHRHTSHLFGLYPGRQITSDQPKLLEAAKQSLNLRGDESTGWALGWRINLWARLHDGDRAYVFVKNLIRPVRIENPDGPNERGGVYDNLFDAHPPFQIDGNFAFTAGLSEMLMQSQEGYIELLPSLPTEVWQDGRIAGLRARGGYGIDLTWKDGSLAEATIRVSKAGPVQVKYGDKVITIETAVGDSIKITPDQFR